MAEAVPTLWQRLCYTRLQDAVRGRFDASLNWRRVLDEAELPDELSQIVRETVHATRLWNPEKVEVARELTAHFQDGLDAGQTVTKLADSFGVPVVAAKLIRRAKRRGRPTAWQIWHYGWLSVAALAAVYLLTGLYMLFGRPTVKTDYLAIINRRALAVPEAKRAWPEYRDALLAMGAKAVPGKYDPASIIPNCDAEPGDANWPEAVQFLRDHAASIAKLRSAASLNDLGFVASNSMAGFTAEDRKLFGVTVEKEEFDAFKSETVADRWLVATLLPNLQQLRTVALLLANDARRAASEGDANTAAADVVALLGVSRHAEETPFLVNLFVANAIQHIGFRTIQETLAEHPELWSADQLRDLAHAIAAAQIDWDRGYEAERLGFYDIVQRLYTDDGQGDGRLAFKVSADRNVFGMLDAFTYDVNSPSTSIWASSAVAALAMPAANLVVASRQEMTEMLERFLQISTTTIRTPLWQQQDIPQLGDEVKSLEKEPLGAYRYLIVRLLFPALDEVRGRIATSAGERDGVLVGLALELYHRGQGQWPKALGELSPRWLPAVPVDRITGQPLGYKIVDDRPVVYSVGVDRDDDGGRVLSDPQGKPDTDLASPIHFSVQPVTDAEHDGDWVIWSTAKSR